MIRPFPERARVNATVGRFCHEHVEALLRWAAWARDRVADWPSTGPGAVPLGQGLMRENLRDFAPKP